jgi:hypothetical protein
MTTPTIGSINPTIIVINWSELTDTSLWGRDTPTYYQLEWYNAEIETPAWEMMNSEANGKVLTFTHNRSPTIFPSATNQQYRINAKNAVGFGTYSSTVTALADAIPIRMNNPTSTSVNPSSISLTWSPITDVADTGRDVVIFYHLQWENGSGTNNWEYLTNYPTSTTIVTSLTHTLSSGIFASGSIQNYKVCA